MKLDTIDEQFEIFISEVHPEMLDARTAFTIRRAFISGAMVAMQNSIRAIEDSSVESLEKLIEYERGILLNCKKFCDEEEATKNN